jgi:tRNA pseudouridine55 synthase
MEQFGFILLEKSVGITSFQALSPLKKVYHPQKVGHTGTLDKFASGLLVVLVGQAVRLNRYFSRTAKRYEGLIRFGIETATGDPQGAVIAEAPPPDPALLEAVLPQFRGTLMQTPPQYSAIHINGTRASDLARAGTVVAMPARPVTIHSLDLLAYEPPFARITVVCSAGTYIRSLAHDIAAATGSCAHLASLTRTHVASFACSDADSTKLLPITQETFAALALPVFSVNAACARQMTHGKPLKDLWTADTTEPTAAIFREDGGLCAVLEQDSAGQWRYGAVFGQ